MVQSVLK